MEYPWFFGHYLAGRRPHRLTVRTKASQALNPGSIPGRVTKCVKQANCFACGHFVKAEAYFLSTKKAEPGSGKFMFDGT